MQQMMSACLGEDVPPEYAGLNREEMGLVSRLVRRREHVPHHGFDCSHVLIVGAGVCGVNAE